MEIEEQAIEENDFRKIVNAHLVNIFGRGERCSFFDGREEDFPKCFLCEYKNSDGEIYFTQEEVSRVCEFYRGDKKKTQFKCFYKIERSD